MEGPKTEASWMVGCECGSCPLRPQMACPPRPPRVAVQPGEPRILFVGQNPGRTELSTFEPFTGASGALLNRALEEIGLSRPKLGLTNTVCCATPNNDPPPAEAVKACQGRVAREVERFNPHLIVAMGAVAIKAITGRTKLDKIHGLECTGVGPYEGRTVIPTYHPAAILRDMRLYPVMLADLRRVKEVAAEQVSGKPNERLGRAGLRDRIKVNIITDVDGLMALLSELQADKPKAIAIDIETDDIRRENNAMHSIAFAWKPDVEEATVVLFDETEREEMRQAGINGWGPYSSSLYQKLAWLWEAFSLTRYLGTKHVYHNGRFDIAQLRRFTLPAKVDGDTNILSYLLDERSDGVHGLEYLANLHFAAGDYKSILKEGDVPDAKGREAMEALPRDLLAIYNGMDAWYTLVLYNKLKPMVDAEGKLANVESLLLRAIEPLLAMENTGLKLDLEAVNEAAIEQEAEVERRRAAFVDMVRVAAGVGEGDLSEWLAKQADATGYKGLSLNPLSSKSMSLLFYDVLKILQPDKHGEKSTGKKAMEGLAERSEGLPAEVASSLLEFRKAHKLLTSYLRKLPKRVSADGRIRTVYKITNTVTGRLASGDDRNGYINLQNAAGKLKKMFVADEGNVLVQGDLCFSGDTLISTPFGDKAIRDVRPGDIVYSWRDGKVVLGTVTQWFDLGHKDVVRVSLDSTESVTCTSDHKFMVGRITQQGKTRHAWVDEIPAGNLKSGDRLIPFRRVLDRFGYYVLYSRGATEYVKEHHLVAEKFLGERPEGVHIHHKNGIKTDNRPENLEYLASKAHLSLHAKDNYAKQDHAVRIEGIRRVFATKDMSGSNNPKYGYRAGKTTICAVCGLEFYRAPSQKAKYCSIACRDEAAARKKVQRIHEQEKPCFVCGKSFYSKRREARYCSRRCYGVAKSSGLNHKVVGVEPLAQTMPVYSIAVEPDHNYALGIGVFVKNCQAEIRTLAHFIQDDRLNQILAAGVDTHVATASLMFGVPPEQVDKTMRQRGKTLAFATVYGQGTYAKAKLLGCSVGEAEALTRQYFAAMPRFAQWKTDVERQALTRGYVEQLTGRRRRFAILHGMSGREADEKIAEVKREAINCLVQGVASDLTLLALCELYDRYKDDPEVRFCATVHDSIVLEVRPHRAQELATALKSTMESVPLRHFGIQVPFVSEVEAGPNWKDMKPLEEVLPVISLMSAANA